MAITIKQIAERAGLSVPTVSRILNNDAELFRPETREKVHAAARELGYRPNSYRMALRTKKFNSIGLLYHPDPALSSLSQAAQCALLHELHRRDQHLVAGQAVHGASNGDALLPKMLREWSVDGLLIDATAASNEVQELIGRTRIPAIWLNIRRPADCVYADLSAGAREGTGQLLSRGHQRIAYLEFTGPSRSTDLRDGCQAALKAAGRTAQVVELPNVDPANRAATLVEWIRAHRGADLPTAIFCRGTDEAHSLYVAAIRAGLSVPRDLSILTVDGGCAATLGLRLSAMHLPTADVAALGLKTLDEKIAAVASDIPPRVIPLTFHEGATLAAPRTTS